MFNDSLPTYYQEAIGIGEPSENGVRKFVIGGNLFLSLPLFSKEGKAK
jgi:hypothetical protein